MLEDLLRINKEILEKLSLLLEMNQQEMNSLTTYKDVAKFLNKSTRTIQNYIKNETFIENVHYYVNSKNRIVFIPKAIIEYRNDSNILFKIKSDEEVQTRIVHPIVSDILKKVS